MVLQNLMRSEPEEESWLGEAQGFIPRGSGAVHGCQSSSTVSCL